MLTCFIFDMDHWLQMYRGADKSVQPGLRGSNDLRVGRKMATFQLFFSWVGLRIYQHPLYISNWT